MAQMTGWPTDGADGSVSSEARWRAMARLWAPSGVVAGFGGELAPTVGSGVINVAAGAAWVDGHYCQLDTPAAETSSATGLLVVRFTPAENKFELVYRDGATTPTQSDAVWELPIAKITGGVMTDVRPMLPPGGSVNSRIAHTVVATSAASIDFDGIPQTFTHLRLIAFLRGDHAVAGLTAYVQINGDSGTTYNVQRIRGSGTTASALFDAATNGFVFGVPGASAFVSYFAPVTFDIPNYRGGGGASKRQSALWTYAWAVQTGSGNPGSGDMRLDTAYGYRGATGSITRLTLIPQNGTWAAGSMATLYGLF